MLERSVEANGLRFSYVEEGDGPLVLLLHGFPPIVTEARPGHGIWSNSHTSTATPSSSSVLEVPHGAFESTFRHAVAAHLAEDLRTTSATFHIAVEQTGAELVLDH